MNDPAKGDRDSGRLSLRSFLAVDRRRRGRRRTPAAEQGSGLHQPPRQGRSGPARPVRLEGRGAGRWIAQLLLGIAQIIIIVNDDPGHRYLALRLGFYKSST